MKGADVRVWHTSAVGPGASKDCFPPFCDVATCRGGRAAMGPSGRVATAGVCRLQVGERTSGRNKPKAGACQKRLRAAERGAAG